MDWFNTGPVNSISSEFLADDEGACEKGNGNWFCDCAAAG
jgi:hypothetical protein